MNRQEYGKHQKALKRHQTARAKLDAAAPDLLEALCELVSLPNKQRPDRIWAQARAAIAKATA